MLKRIAWGEVAKLAARIAIGPVAIAGVLIVVFLVGEWRDLRRMTETLQANTAALAKKTERVAEAPAVKIEAPLVAPAVAPKVVRRIAKDYAKPTLATVDEAGTVIDSAGHAIKGGIESSDLLVTEVQLPILPDGGGAIVTRAPGGAVEVTVRAKPRRFFDLRSEWSIGAMVDPLDLAGGNGTIDGRAFVRYSGLRLGRVHAIAEAGGERLNGRSGGYVLVGAEVRFGSR